MIKSLSSLLRFAKSPNLNFIRFKNGRRGNHGLEMDMIGAWDTTTDLPLEIDVSIEKGKPIPKILNSSVGSSSVKGRLATQEDQYGVELLRDDLLYVGVFDGHGGSACSQFCAHQMPRHIEYWLNHKPDFDPVSILHCSFLELNNAFARWSAFNKALNEGSEYSGSTATVCLLHKNVGLAIGHVGDSRAILCRSGEARKLTMDHVPELREERERILKSGGRIENNRINGRLNMTRSLGDSDLKRYGVIAEPLVRLETVNHSKDAFLVLTTDGINSVVNDQEIVELVKQASDPKEAAHLVTDFSLQCSSEDNATVVVIPLGSWGRYSAAQTIFHSFGRSMASSSRY